MHDSPLVDTANRSRKHVGWQPETDSPTACDPLAGGELGLITRDVAVRTGAQTGLLAIWNPTEQLADVICAWSDAPVNNRMPTSVRRRSGFVGRVLSSGHAAFEPINPARDASLGQPPSGARLRYAAGAPVHAPDGPPGALCVGFCDRPHDPAVTPWMVERYAGLAALCLHDAGVLDGLLAAARVDGLTGLPNYAAIRAELEREIARSARHRRPMSCAFIDLDHFKRVNERHGHLDGSTTLTEVAAILQGGVRIGDMIGRYGGDEFLAILPDTDHDAACALADRLRTTLSTTPLTRAFGPLSASVGVAQWHPGVTADEMLAAADAALRSAKRAGGDLVVGADGVAANNGRDTAPTANAEFSSANT